jgi:hypothetical protein
MIAFVQHHWKLLVGLGLFIAIAGTIAAVLGAGLWGYAFAGLLTAGPIVLVIDRDTPRHQTRHQRTASAAN